MEEDMELPEGKTCRDCVRFLYCVAFLDLSGEETSCDWSPSYFVDEQALILKIKAKKEGA